jgi:protein PhnA
MRFLHYSDVIIGIEQSGNFAGIPAVRVREVLLKCSKRRFCGAIGHICETCKAKSKSSKSRYRSLALSQRQYVESGSAVRNGLSPSASESDQLDMMYLKAIQILGASRISILLLMMADQSFSATATAILAEGDTVTLIKDLEVKGAGFTAKRGTIVKNIRLTDDARFIEGKINGSTIVLVAAFMKKA